MLSLLLVVTITDFLELIRHSYTVGFLQSNRNQIKTTINRTLAIIYLFRNK